MQSSDWDGLSECVSAPRGAVGTQPGYLHLTQQFTQNALQPCTWRKPAPLPPPLADFRCHACPRLCPGRPPREPSFADLPPRLLVPVVRCSRRRKRPVQNANWQEQFRSSREWHVKAWLYVVTRYWTQSRQYFAAAIATNHFFHPPNGQLTI
jgi:hypothetical protein